MFNTTLAKGDLLIYSKEATNGLSIKVGPVNHVKRKRDGSIEYKVNTFNQKVNSSVPEEDVVPVLTFMTKSTFDSLVEQGVEFNVIVPDNVETEVLEGIEELEDELDEIDEAVVLDDEVEEMMEDGEVEGLIPSY